MSENQFGTTQVREMRFERSEIEALILENIRNRDSCPYDFDYSRPIILWDKDALILRFVQSFVTKEGRPDRIRLKSFEDIKAKK